MDSISLDNLISLEINPAKTIFWVGSGASYDNPCGLPIGNTLADEYLNSALGKCKAEKLKQQWTSAIENISDYPRAKEYNMRLEFIIGVINQIDIEFSNITFKKSENQKKYKRFPLINGFSSFANQSYNYNHYALAKLIQAGGVLVTTNYDLCIENALNLPYDKREYLGVDTVLCSSSINCYHIHGIAEDRDMTDTMGATIKRVKRKLPSKFSSKLRNYFDQGYNIVFIGYSGSDFFDVTPFFESLPRNQYRGTALFFNHNAPVFSSKIDVLMAPFQSKIQVYGNTNNFVYHLCKKSRLVIDKPEKWLKDNKEQAKDWRNGFNQILNHYKTNNALETFHFINALKLTNQSGIHIRSLYPDWEKRIVNIILDWTNDSGNTLKHLISEPHDLNQSILSDIEYYARPRISKRIARVYAPIQCGKREYRKNICVLPDRNTRLSYKDLHQRVSEAYLTIINDCQDTKYRDNESFVIQYLNIQCRQWVNLWKAPWNRTKALNELRRLKIEIDRLSKLPYSQFLYISYYLNVWNNKNLIDNIIEEHPLSDHRNIEFEISLEIASIGTMGRVYDNLAHQYLIKAIKNYSMPMLFKAGQYYKKGNAAHKFMKG